jgi:intracellular sulfur oxidation DsrE/DsrF family protein
MLRITRACLQGAAIVATVVTAMALGTSAATARGPGDPNDEWLVRLDGRYRMLFDAPTTNNGAPLDHLMSWYDTYNSAYGVPDEKLDGVFTFYSKTTFHGLNDTMWAKYDLGAFIGERDPDGNPYTVNPWRTTPEVLGMTLPQASIESMQRRGATFILCNNALTFFAGLLAEEKGLDITAVYEDLKANILPGVTLVPGMVVAIDKAQQAGLSYIRQ